MNEEINWLDNRSGKSFEVEQFWDCIHDCLSFMWETVFEGQLGYDKYTACKGGMSTETDQTKPNSWFSLYTQIQVKSSLESVD